MTVSEGLPRAGRLETERVLSLVSLLKDTAIPRLPETAIRVAPSRFPARANSHLSL